MGFPLCLAYYQLGGGGAADRCRTLLEFPRYRGHLGAAVMVVFGSAPGFVRIRSSWIKLCPREKVREGLAYTPACLLSSRSQVRFLPGTLWEDEALLGVRPSEWSLFLSSEVAL